MYLYMLKKVRLSEFDHPPVGTVFIRSNSRLYASNRFNRYQGLFRVTGYPDRAEFTVCVDTLTSYPNVSSHGFLYANQPVDSMPVRYDSTWRGYYMPKTLFVLVPHTTCMFSDNVRVHARRSGEWAKDVTKAHTFVLNGNNVPQTVCSSRPEWGYGHVVLLEDMPTCKRCLRIMNDG